MDEDFIISHLIDGTYSLCFHLSIPFNYHRPEWCNMYILAVCIAMQCKQAQLLFLYLKKQYLRWLVCIESPSLNHTTWANYMTNWHAWDQRLPTSCLPVRHVAFGLCNQKYTFGYDGICKLAAIAGYHFDYTLVSNKAILQKLLVICPRAHHHNTV